MALPETSSKDGQNNKSTDQDDKDFDPSAQALIDDIDDERTLEEEEALDGNNVNRVQEELDDLKKESEMPIEELLAYYERMRNEAQGEANSDEDQEDEDEEDEEDEIEGEEEDDSDKHGPKGGKDSDGRENSRSFVDSTSQQKGYEPKQNQPPESKSPQSQKQQKSLQNSGLADSDAHSTSTSSDRIIEADSAQQPVGADQTHNSAGQVSGSFNAEGAQAGRPRHPMTNFVIADESEGDMFKTLLGYDLDDSDDMDDDYSYENDENGDDERDWRRVIHVGPEYQAEVPESLCEYNDLPPYENQDTLLWKYNSNLTKDKIIDYLKQASLLSKRNDISISPASVPKISNDTLRLYRERMQDITSSTGSYTVEHNHENIIIEHPPDNLPDVYMSQSRKRVRIDYELEQENAIDKYNQSSDIVQNQITSSREDNSDSTSQETRPELSTEDYFQDEEQLLYLLLQCNYNFDEALRRRKLDPFKYYLHEPMSLWSQEECLGFEHGLRIYGKNFRSIRDNNVQTRSCAEVVAFYYLWKKSERHDVYTNQYKLDRKRSLTHPGTTDYMDKFIEDNESALNASSSTTPTTPTESNVCINSNAIASTEDNVSMQQKGHHAGTTEPASIQYVNLPHVSPIHHLIVHQPQKDNEGGQNNSFFIDSNTPL